MNVSNIKNIPLYQILWESNDDLVKPVRELLYKEFVDTYAHLLPNDIKNGEIVNKSLLTGFKIEFASLFKENLETGDITLNADIDAVLKEMKTTPSVKVNNTISLNTSTISTLLYWFIFGTNDVLNRVRHTSPSYINFDYAITRNLDWFLYNFTLQDTKKLVFYAGSYNTEKTKLNEYAIKWNNIGKLFQFNYKDELSKILWEEGSKDFKTRLEIMRNYDIVSWDIESYSQHLKKVVFKELDEIRKRFVSEMFAFKLRGILSFNPYEGKDQSATLLDLNTISFAHKKGWVNLGDLTLKTHTVIRDGKFTLPLSIRRSIVDIQPNGDKYLLLTSSIMSNNPHTFNVEYRQKFLDIEYALTHNLVEGGNLKGVTFINRSSNSNFMVQKYSQNQLITLALHGRDEDGNIINTRSKYLSTPTDYNYDYPLFGDEFAGTVKEILLSIAKVLKEWDVLSTNVPYTERGSIHKYIRSKDNVPHLKEPTTFIKNKIEYVKDVPLSDNERNYKFYAFDTLSASQLNAIAFEMGGVKQTSYNDWFLPENQTKLQEAIDNAIFNKYGFKVKKSRKKDALRTLNKITFSEHEQNRMDFGNEVEQSILNQINGSLLNDEKPIKMVKETLYYDKQRIFVDIDGFRGEDLDNLESVVEVKTSCARGGYEEEVEHGNMIISNFNSSIYVPSILTKYYFQLLTYYNVFKPQYLEIVGVISSSFNGKNSKIFKHKFYPNHIDLTFYENILNAVKARFDVLLKSDEIFDFEGTQTTLKDIVNKFRDEKYQHVKHQEWVQKYR